MAMAGDAHRDRRLHVDPRNPRDEIVVEVQQLDLLIDIANTPRQV
jgi:hypothetical protein